MAAAAALPDGLPEVAPVDAAVAVEIEPGVALVLFEGVNERRDV
jgi:hypothetical protein